MDTKSVSDSSCEILPALQLAILQVVAEETEEAVCCFLRVLSTSFLLLASFYKIHHLFVSRCLDTDLTRYCRTPTFSRGHWKSWMNSWGGKMSWFLANWYQHHRRGYSEVFCRRCLTHDQTKDYWSSPGNFQDKTAGISQRMQVPNVLRLATLHPPTRLSKDRRLQR